MAASGSLAGGTGSRALLWAAVQACHMVRLGQAGHHVGLQLLPQAPKDNCSALGNKTGSRRSPGGSAWGWGWGAEGLWLFQTFQPGLICMHLPL